MYIYIYTHIYIYIYILYLLYAPSHRKCRLTCSDGPPFKTRHQAWEPWQNGRVADSQKGLGKCLAIFSCGLFEKLKQKTPSKFSMNPFAQLFRGVSLCMVPWHVSIAHVWIHTSTTIANVIYRFIRLGFPSLACTRTQATKAKLVGHEHCMARSLGSQTSEGQQVSQTMLSGLVHSCVSLSLDPKNIYIYITSFLGTTSKLK